MRYRITQVAERSGIPASTIRYYEEEGLLPPAAREDNGYRTYDDHDVARLRFLDRVRALDLPVDALGELVDLREDPACGPVVEEFRERVSGRVAETQRRIAAPAALAGDLQHALSRLQGPMEDLGCAGDAHRCSADVAATAPTSTAPTVTAPASTVPATPAPATTAATDTAATDTAATDTAGTTLPVAEKDPLACTLEPERMPARMTEWQQLVARAQRQDPIADGGSLRFPVDIALAGEITTLAAAEHDCCPFFRFGLRISSDALHLEVTGPPATQPMIAAVFGVPGPAGTADG